jgi:hypothetical protein
MPNISILVEIEIIKLPVAKDLIKGVKRIVHNAPGKNILKRKVLPKEEKFFKSPPYKQESYKETFGIYSAL